jgi:glutamyl-tRNA synthetase
MRETARRQGHAKLYDGRWRDRPTADAPPGVTPVIRLRAPTTGFTEIADLVQGTVRVANEQLDDMVLLRSDGTPTYMLSVVVDDHDMAITHVVRGDDHLTNAFRQRQLFEALDWAPPAFAHIPLIHGADGAKLSKRHGAVGLEAYREMGILPDAMRNYLLRLGWGHGDAEIISTAEAVRIFDLTDVGRSPSRFDMGKLLNTNGHYIRAATDSDLVAYVMPFLEQKLGCAPGELERTRLTLAMGSLKARAKTLLELADRALFYCRAIPLPFSEEARALIRGDGAEVIAGLTRRLAAVDPWTDQSIEAAVRDYAAASGRQLGAVAQPLRAALTGSTASPGIFEVAAILGRNETLARLAAAGK